MNKVFLIFFTLFLSNTLLSQSNLSRKRIERTLTCNNLNTDSLNAYYNPKGGLIDVYQDLYWELEEVAFYNDHVASLMPEMTIVTVLTFLEDSLIKGTYLFHNKEVSIQHYDIKKEYRLEIIKTIGERVKKIGFQFSDINKREIEIYFDSDTSDVTKPDGRHFGRLDYGQTLINHTIKICKFKPNLIVYSEFSQRGQLIKEGSYQYVSSATDTITQINPFTLEEEEIARTYPVYEKANDWKYYLPK